MKVIVTPGKDENGDTRLATQGTTVTLENGTKIPFVKKVVLTAAVGTHWKAELELSALPGEPILAQLEKVMHTKVDIESRIELEEYKALIRLFDSTPVEEPTCEKLYNEIKNTLDELKDVHIFINRFSGMKEALLFAQKLYNPSVFIDLYVNGKFDEIRRDFPGAPEAIYGQKIDHPQSTGE